jgi:hypothetical protein
VFFSTAPRSTFSRLRRSPQRIKVHLDSPVILKTSPPSIYAYEISLSAVAPAGLVGIEPPPTPDEEEKENIPGVSGAPSECDAGTFTLKTPSPVKRPVSISDISCANIYCYSQLLLLSFVSSLVLAAFGSDKVH